MTDMDNTTYAATSAYAAELATLALKGATALGVLATDRVTALAGTAAATAVAIERGGGKAASDSLTEGTVAWNILHRALARTVDAEPGDHVGDVLADVSVQAHAQRVMAAVDDPSKEATLERADRNLAAAVREDGGDIADLTKRRALGAYHEMTPDQQDDVAEAIATRSAIPAALAAQVDTTRAVAEAIRDDREGTMLDRAHRHFDRIEHSRLRTVSIVRHGHEIG